MALLAIIGLHGVLALGAGLLGRRLGRNVLLLTAIGPAAAVGWLALQTGQVLDGEPVAASVPWVPGMDLSIELYLDGTGLLFWWLIAGIGLLVMVYATRYFSRRRDLGRFASMLVLFAGSMLLLTAADNVLLVFVAWELTSITSYLLIGFDDDRAEARASALQALLVTAAGGLALLGGLLLMAWSAGTASLGGILAVVPTDTPAQVGLALVLLGAATKSAQAPFHFWLPGAMAAPTPVSAYLHSATMVKAGVYLFARFGPAFGPEVDWWPTAVVTMGGISMLLGGWRALRATDLKALLAYGTVSQLGFIIMLVGHGNPELTHAGVTLILAHALFKATLFLTAGVVDHQAHTRDLRRLTGIARRLPVTAVAMVVAGASMAGVIPLFGFIAKEAALESSLHVGFGRLTMTTVIVVGSIFTTAYTIRLLWGALATKDPDQLDDDAVDPADVARANGLFAAPAVVLTVFTVLFGLWVTPADELVSAAAGALAGPEAADIHLALWHGFGPPLLLSVIALAGGYWVWTFRDEVERLGAITGRVPDMEHAYRAWLRGLLAGADRVTTIVQPGSLPLYGAVVLATVLVLPGMAMVDAFAVPDDLVGAESWLQVAIAAMIVGAAIGAAWVRRRLAAVLMLGAVGYGVAVLFVVQGAPDLALTQLLVETLSLGIFVLVLRRLPETFASRPWRFGFPLRATVSVGIGLFVGMFTLMASSTGRTGAAAEFLSNALPEGGGSNVVNVILTDFRALDTFGEITVLVVAAIGISLMVRAPLRDDDEPGPGAPGAGPDSQAEADVGAGSGHGVAAGSDR